jgi:hypothetical protein
VTDAGITLLRPLAEADVVTIMPDANTAAALTRFDATLESLREMKKAGWVALEVADEQKRRRGRHRQTIRCTEAGREALRLLGDA